MAAVELAGACDFPRPSAPMTVFRDMTNTTTTNESIGIRTQDAESTARDTESTGCCGGPATANASACCAQDEEVKASGGAGCGCNPTPAAPRKSCC